MPARRISNLTFPSRIFYRKSSKISEDPDFVEAVTGRENIKAIKKHLPLLSKAKITYEQKVELKEGEICSLKENINRERTHGLVYTKDGLRWSCRCENKTCGHYRECIADPFAKEITRKALRPSIDDLPPFYFPALGIRLASLEDMLAFLNPSREKGKTVAAPRSAHRQPKRQLVIEEGASPPPESGTIQGAAEKRPFGNNTASSPASEKLDLPGIDKIIEEAKSSSFLSNAFSLSNPLDINNGEEDGEGDFAVSPLGMPQSFADKSFTGPLQQTQPLSDIGSIIGSITQPISAPSLETEFTPPAPKYYQTASSELEAISMPVSGILAVERAEPEMLISRFKYITGQNLVPQGKILLVCQNAKTRESLVAKASSMGLDISPHLATYDSMPPLAGSSIQYMVACEVESIGENSKERFLSYLLSAQCGYTLLGDRYFFIPTDDSLRSFYLKLDRMLISAKAAMFRLPKDDRGFYSAFINNSADDASRAFYSLPKEDAQSFSSPVQRAYLLDSQGEAVKYSTELWQRGLNNRILTDSSSRDEPIGRWLADMFWDIRASSISFEDFEELYEYRASQRAQNAREAYGALLKVYGSEGSLNFSAMFDDPKKFPSAVKGANKIWAYVCTVNEAKSSRFEKAVIAFEPETPEKAAYIGYIASVVSGGNVYTTDPIEPANMAGGQRGRFIEEDAQGAPIAVQVGLEGDIADNYYGPRNPRDIELQAYIGRRVKEGDPVTVANNLGYYAILHGDKEIARLSAEAEKEVVALENSARLQGLYISDIVTVMTDGAFRLGVRVAGMAKA